MMKNIEEMIDEYIDYINSRGLSKHTAINYKVDLTHFNTYLSNQGIFDIKDIDPMAVRVFISSIIGYGEAKTSVSRRLSAVRGFTGWLLRNKFIASDPVLGLKGPKNSEVIPKVLSYSKIDKLLTQGPDKQSDTYQRDRLILETLYGSALRVSELIALNWNVIDIEARILIVYSKKGDKERFIPFGITLSKMFQEWRNLTCVDPNGPVFRSDKKNAERLTVRTVDRIVLKAAQRVGLKEVTPNTLRSSSAKHMLENGAPLRIVQEFLGHESIAATQRYLLINSCLNTYPMLKDEENSNMQEEI